MIKNALSVDLEMYSHGDFTIKENRPLKEKQYFVKNTKSLLKLFDRLNTKATFFVVGQIYDWCPELIEIIKSSGHEIGYQSHHHILLRNKADLISELKLSRKFLKKFKPIGFRAPRIFFRKEYFPILSDFGFKYDSSTYGPFESARKYSGVKELPVSQFNYLPNFSPRHFPRDLKTSLLQGIPYGSGLFISILQKYTQAFINNTNKKNQPAILFIHPWQLFNWPKTIPFKNWYNFPKLLYTRNIESTVKYLLSNNQFVPLKDLLNEA